MRAAVVTISSSVAGGAGEDVSGRELVELCRTAGLETVHETVSDDRSQISTVLKRLADHEGVRFVFTTGGTGMTPDDVTPEATADVIERNAPGFSEAIRAQAACHTPLGILSRGVSGLRRRTLIVNMPGSPNGVRQSWPVIEPTLRHAAETLERR
jgi:molybdopterin adenylyltransferase